MVSCRQLQLRGWLPATPNLSTSPSTPMFLYFATCANVLMCLTMGVTCLEPKGNNNLEDMAENKETTYVPENDYVDLMRTEGYIAEEDSEYESTRSQLDGFYYFRDVQQHKISQDFPEWNLGEIERKLVEIWNNADAETQIKYVNDAVTELERNHEQDYTLPQSENDIGRGIKHECNKDPTTPKRSLSAFFWWSLDERGKVRELYPKYTEGDIARELSKRWIAVDSETKSKYEAKAADDDARYEREMNEYKKKKEM